MKRTAVLAAALVASGAALADHRDIDVEDRSTFIPSARLSVDIAPRGEAPSVPHAGHAIEFGITGASGDDNQNRVAGAPTLVFGGQSFAAPVELHHEYEFRFAEVAYRYRHFFSEQIGIEALGGLGYAQYELTVSTPTVSTSEKLSSGGLVGGIGFIWKFLPQTSLQSRLTGFGSGDSEGVTSAARFDLFIVQALGRYAAVRAGLTSWRVNSEREEDEDFSTLNSRIDGRFSGVSLGLELAF